MKVELQWNLTFWIFFRRALYYNSNSLNIVKLFLEGNFSKKCDPGEGQRGVEQLAVPPKFCGKPYGDLFLGLLKEYGILALGLFRCAGTLGSPVSYVYTNPVQDAIVNDDDLIYVLL